MKNKFFTKAGRLTPYALACGYIEKREGKNGVVRLWREGCYHVRQHNYNKGIRIFWESFDKLTDARKCYDTAK